MDKALVDEALQENIQITSFLRSGGLRIFLEKLGNLTECYCADKEKLMDQGILELVDMSKLNKVIGQIKAVNAVYAILDEMEEMVSENEEMPEMQ